MPDFFDPLPERQNVVLVDATTVRKAERLIIGCEACSPGYAEIPFDNVLDEVTGNDPTVTDYMIGEVKARCRNCKREINEKTLVEID